MRPLGCKSYTTSLPHSNQMPRFLKLKGCKVRPNLNIAYLVLLSKKVQSQLVSVEVGFTDFIHQDTEYCLGIMLSQNGRGEHSS